MAPIDFYYFAPSSPCRKVLLTIRNLGLDVNIKYVDIWEKEQLKPEFVKINPQHCVPTINDNGFVLWESGVICSYLVDAKSPDNSLYPKDPKIRAIINQRIFFELITLHPSIRAISVPAIYYGKSALTDETIKNLHNAFEQLNTYLESQNWVAGGTLTIADLIILAPMSSAINSGASIDKYNNIKSWYERCKSLPGFNENDEGAKIYGGRVKPVLKQSF